MARDIDVDEQELHRFIQTLADFQELTSDKLKAVESAWLKCDESWKGASKKQFTKEFEQTKQAVEDALAAGEDAHRWLERFDEIVREFERQY